MRESAELACEPAPSRKAVLKFPVEVETQFRAQFDSAAKLSTPATARMILFVIAVFAFLDRFALPTSYQHAWALRPWLQGAPTLFLIFFSRYAVLAAHIQMCIAGCLMLGGTGTLLILAQSGPQELGYTLYPYALAQIAMLAYNGSRLRYPYALTVGIFLTLGYVLTALLAQGVLQRPSGAVAFALPLFFLLAINTIGASSCLNTERLLRRDFLQRRMIEAEHARAEALLLDMLPAAIAPRLKRSERIADTHNDVGVLFADLSNFTAYAATRPAAEIVTLLDALFKRFDILAARHAVEKIKTIGDAYMAASGVPLPRQDHLCALARLALAMRATVDELRVLAPELNLRIGIASGPVVAGVIGSRRCTYDLWGDTVNLASRLQEFGLPGEIQIDARSAMKLRTHFHLKMRGPIVLKGKGTHLTYWLVGERNIE